MKEELVNKIIEMLIKKVGNTPSSFKVTKLKAALMGSSIDSLKALFEVGKSELN